jgi:DDE superfamily endonuclease
VEKKQHTLKNTVMSLPDKFIVFLGRTFSGHHHDYTMLKQELPPDLDWFTDINVRVDLGYLGIQSDYSGNQIDIPTKKPRKSQKHPNPQLSDEQKAANKALSQIRIFIEHAIGGMKRYNILVHAFRNRLENFEDDVIGVCAGLWNFVLSY